MKFLLCLLGLMLVAAAQANEDACLAGDLASGYHPHDVYCNKFFSCVPGMIWYESTCAANYLWNNNESRCDYPENVDCGSLIIPAQKYTGENIGFMF